MTRGCGNVVEAHVCLGATVLPSSFLFLAVVERKRHLRPLPGCAVFRDGDSVSRGALRACVRVSCGSGRPCAGRCAATVVDFSRCHLRRGLRGLASRLVLRGASLRSSAVPVLLFAGRLLQQCERLARRQVYRCLALLVDCVAVSMLAQQQLDESHTACTAAHVSARPCRGREQAGVNTHRSAPRSAAAWRPWLCGSAPLRRQ